MAQASKTGVADLITEGVTGSDDEPTTRPEVRDTTTLKELEIVFATSSQSVASVVNEQSEGAASQQIVRHLSSVPNEQSEMEAEHLHILSSRSVAHGDGRIKVHSPIILIPVHQSNITVFVLCTLVVFLCRNYWKNSFVVSLLVKQMLLICRNFYMNKDRNSSQLSLISSEKSAKLKQVLVTEWIVF